MEPSRRLCEVTISPSRKRVKQRAAAAHVGDQRLVSVDAQGVAHRLADGGDGQPAFLAACR